MKKVFDPRRLDVKAFAEEAAELEGQDPVREHARLVDETQGRGEGNPVRWRAVGELRNPRHVNPEVWLHLHAQAVLPLTCQRCLQPVDVPAAVERSFRFVADEQTAAAQDDESEEDVLALSRSFDLVELVEDELLMELPLAPRHDVCPEPLPLPVEADEAPELEVRENPFAVLARLKKPH
jgi:uncharacterized protein